MLREQNKCTTCNDESNDQVNKTEETKSEISTKSKLNEELNKLAEELVK